MLGSGELLRSTDTGRHFRRVGSPPFPSEGTVPTLAFANPRDGFAYVLDSGPLYATYDGGRSWRRIGPKRGAVRAFAVGTRFAYAVFGRRQFARLPIGRGSWRTLSLPFAVTAGPVGLAARGSHVWVTGTAPSRKPQAHSRLALSDDDAATFATRASPCYPGLGGRLVPAAGGAVWAVCPSGMMAAAFHSANGGRSFRHLPILSLTNGAEIAPTSGRAAVLSGGGGGPLLRTTDAGRHWAPIAGTSGIQQVFWLGFATNRIGLVVVQTAHDGVQLWRTTDAGTTWRTVRFR